jgi:hypothetical protein
MVLAPAVKAAQPAFKLRKSLAVKCLLTLFIATGSSIVLC